LGRVTFSLFGRDFQFISDKDDDEKLVNLAELFQKKIELLKKETKESDSLKLLVFLCINLLNENLKLKEEINKDNSKENESIILQLIEKIKKTTNKD